jgi:hypothetical protein
MKVIVLSSFSAYTGAFVILQQAREPGELDLPKEAKAVADSLKQEVEGFELVKSGVIKLNNMDAIQVEYRAVEGTTTFSKVMVIVPDKELIYYLLYTVEGKTTEPIKSDITEINQSFLNYVK